MRYVCPLVAICLSHLAFSTLLRGAETEGDVEVRRADIAVQAAREHVRNFLEGDFNKMEKTYAKQIILMPGNELLKAKYGLAGANGEKEAITVDRTKLLGTMKKSLPRPLIAANIVDKVFEAYRFEPLKTKVGDFATVPPDPVETPDGKLHFTIADGDVLFKVGPEKGDFMLFQFRQIEGKWQVVAEYLD